MEANARRAEATYHVDAAQMRFLSNPNETTLQLVLDAYDTLGDKDSKQPYEERLKTANYAVTADDYASYFNRIPPDSRLSKFATLLAHYHAEPGTARFYNCRDATHEELKHKLTPAQQRTLQQALTGDVLEEILTTAGI